MLLGLKILEDNKHVNVIKERPKYYERIKGILGLKLVAILLTKSLEKRIYMPQYL